MKNLLIIVITTLSLSAFGQDNGTLQKNRTTGIMLGNFGPYGRDTVASAKALRDSIAANKLFFKTPAAFNNYAVVKQLDGTYATVNMRYDHLDKSFNLNNDIALKGLKLPEDNRDATPKEYVDKKADTSAVIKKAFSIGKLAFGNTDGGLTQASTLFFNSTTNVLGIGTSTPNTTNGRGFHIYNDLNTGNVASNAFGIIESLNRNPNLLFLFPTTGAGGLIWKNNAETITYGQITAFPNAGQSYLDIAGGAIANAMLRLWGYGTNKLMIIGPTTITNPNMLSASYPIGLAGSILPLVHDTYIIGDATHRINNIYASGANFTNTNITETYTNLNPSGVALPHIMTVTGLGDNTTFKGVGALQINANDDVSVTNSTKGVLYGLNLNVRPLVSRNNVPFDDIGGIIISNTSPNGSKGTDAINISNPVGGTNVQWLKGIQIDPKVDIGIDFAVAPTIGVLRMPNNSNIVGRNFANTLDISAVKIDASDRLSLIDGAATLTSAGLFTSTTFAGTRININGSSAGYRANIAVANGFNVNDGLTVERGTSSNSAGFRLISDGSGNYHGGITWKGTSVAEKEYIAFGSGSGSDQSVWLYGKTVTQGVIRNVSTTKTSAYSVTETDHIIVTDSSTGAFNVTLLSSASIGQVYIIDNSSATSNAVTVVGTINGATNYSLNATKYVTLYKTATATNTWRIIANN